VVGHPRCHPESGFLQWHRLILPRQKEPADEALPPIARAINVFDGEVTSRAVAETFTVPYNGRFEC